MQHNLLEIQHNVSQIWVLHHSIYKSKNNMRNKVNNDLKHYLFVAYVIYMIDAALKIGCLSRKEVRVDSDVMVYFVVELFNLTMIFPSEV